MVINDVEDEEECSLVIHNDGSMIEKDVGAENSDTLTRSFAGHMNIDDRSAEKSVASCVFY